MRTDIKKTIIISIIFLAVVLGLMLIVGKIRVPFDSLLAVPPLDTDIGECSGGFTTLSVDDVVINGDINRIRVTGIAKGSECLKIQLRKSELNSKLDDLGLQATQDILGEIRLLEYTKTFPIDPSGNSYDSLQVGTFNSIMTFDICSVNNCKKRVSQNTIDTFQTGLILQTCNCIYTGTNGLHGDFSNSRYYGNFKVRFTLGGGTVILTGRPKSNDEIQQSVNIGNHHIEWVGNLLNLDGIGVPQYDGRMILSKWDLVQDEALSRVENSLIEFKRCFTTGHLAGTSGQYATCKANFDLTTNNILTNKLDKYRNDNAALIYDADTDNNALYVSLKASPFPAFILDLDAESVGIISLEGKPEITQCIPNQKLKSGDNEIVSFRVKNAVDVDGVEFFGNIICDKGGSGFFPNFDINGLEEKTIQAELIPSNPNPGTLTGNCELKVRDLKSRNSDSCNFDIEVEYVSGRVCEPNSLSCDEQFRNIMRCTSDGKNLELYEQCTYGCEITSTGAKCIGEPPPPPPSDECESCLDWFTSLFKKEENKCKPGSVIETKWYNPFSWIINLTGMGSHNIWCPIFLGIVLLVFIFSTLFGQALFYSFPALQDKVWLTWLLGLGIAVVLAFITYYAFIVGIIAFVIYIVIKMIISGTVGKFTGAVRRL